MQTAINNDDIESSGSELLLQLELKLGALSYLMQFQNQPNYTEINMPEVWIGLALIIDDLKNQIIKIKHQVDLNP